MNDDYIEVKLDELIVQGKEIVENIKSSYLSHGASDYCKSITPYLIEIRYIVKTYGNYESKNMKTLKMALTFFTPAMLMSSNIKEIRNVGIILYDVYYRPALDIRVNNARIIHAFDIVVQIFGIAKKYAIYSVVHDFIKNNYRNRVDHKVYTIKNLKVREEK